MDEYKFYSLKSSDYPSWKNKTVGTWEKAIKLFSSGYECIYTTTRSRTVVFYTEEFSDNGIRVDIYLREFGHALYDLHKLNWYNGFTPESIKKALREMPTIRDWVLSDTFCDQTYKGKKLTVSEDTYRKPTAYRLYQLLPPEQNNYSGVKSALDYMLDFADTVISELLNGTFHKDDLIQKPREKKSNSSNLLEIGGKVALRFGVRMLARAIGGDLDIGGDSGDSGISIDVPDIDFDIDGIDGDFNFDFADGYYGDGLSFMGKTKDSLPSNANSDGYIPDGSISLTRTISDITDTFKHYRKDGHDFVLYYGNYIRVDGSGTVTIGGVKYDKK